MRPAVSRGLWVATAAAALVLVAGLASIAQAARRSQPGSPSPR
jgi:hypothetical protein